MTQMPKNGNGNGNGKTDSSDDLTPVGPPVGHAGNREFLAIMGNYLLEAKQHTIRLESLYEELRSLTRPAPEEWAAKTLVEFERHHASDGSNLSTLRSYVKAG